MSQNSGDRVYLVKFDQNGGFGDPSRFDIPIPLKGALVPPWLYQPALAGAPLAGSNEMRVAWLLERGLAVLDLQEGSKVTPLLEPEGQVFLTGLLGSQGIPRLTISRDGNFVLLSSQRDFGAVPDVRVFDLRVQERRALLNNLGGEKLREVACRVAGFLPSSSSTDAMTAPPEVANTGQTNACASVD